MSPSPEGIHEQRRVRRESEEASNPPEADAPRGGGGVAEAEGAMEAPKPPASGLESGGEEDAIARYVFSIPAEEYRPSTSAYIRVKVFKKTILAKMLIDSGNLVTVVCDLISREFADLAGLQYEPERKKVGTAAKGGSVSIVGRLIQPLQLHIENISTPVFLRPYVVEELLYTYTYTYSNTYTYTYTYTFTYTY